MPTPLEMRQIIYDVYCNGFENHIYNILIENEDRLAIHNFKNPDYISEALIEAYYCSINIKKNISSYPQIITARIEHCEMSGDAELYLNQEEEKNKHHLIKNEWVNYIIEYKARMFGINGFIEDAFQSLMEHYYANKSNDDDDELNDNEIQERKDNERKLIDSYALVRYYCKDVYVFDIGLSEDRGCYSRLVESAKISGLDKKLAEKFPVEVKFSEEDRRNKCYDSPLDLFRLWENDLQLTEIDLKYIKTFNIAIYFTSHIKEFNIYRKSFVYYNENKDCFVHLTEDQLNGSSGKLRFDYNSYKTLDDVNNLILMAKKYDFHKFALINKDSVPRI